MVTDVQGQKGSQLDGFGRLWQNTPGDSPRLLMLQRFLLLPADREVMGPWPIATTTTKRPSKSFSAARGVPYVAVDEARRSLLADGRSIKSLDFIVASPGGETWLVDVKGRRFPSGDETCQYWKNWSPQEDIDSLGQWEKLFGDNSADCSCSATMCSATALRCRSSSVSEFRQRLYAFLAVRLDDYAVWSRPISERWDTVAMPTAVFRRIAQPVEELLGTPLMSARVPG